MKPSVSRQILTAHRSFRAGRLIDHIVIHYTTSRNIEDTIQHFMSGEPRVSAHYVIGQDGELVQMVPDDMAAWHAGVPGMNARSIGIEHVAAAGDRITPVRFYLRALRQRVVLAAGSRSGSTACRRP